MRKQGEVLEKIALLGSWEVESDVSSAGLKGPKKEVHVLVIVQAWGATPVSNAPVKYELASPGLFPLLFATWIRRGF